MERIAQRNRFWRFLNEQEDRQELSDYRTKITEAKLQFLVSLPPRLLPRSKSIQVATEMAKSQTLQREQKYPVFSLADLELQQMLNSTNRKHTRAVARLVPHRKRVLVRQYQTKSVSHKQQCWLFEHSLQGQDFVQDIEALMRLRYEVPSTRLDVDRNLDRHPNLPFLGASSLISPAPFIVMELCLSFNLHT